MRAFLELMLAALEIIVCLAMIAVIGLVLAGA